MTLLDQTTLNPVPFFGTYKRKQVDRNSTTVAVIFNTSFSSELPYDNRSITVELGSKSQSQGLDPTQEMVQFEFDLSITKKTSYSLAITYAAVDNIATPYLHGGSISHKSSGTIDIEPPSPHSIGSKQVQYNSLLLVFITFIFLF